MSIKLIYNSLVQIFLISNIKIYQKINKFNCI